jgi:MFS superfamily sulfate permease-like transporter
MMAVVSGTVCILAGVVRLGFVTELLSKPIRYGYMNGIALAVLISQLPKLFGFQVENEGPLRDVWSIIRAVVDGRTNWTNLAVGAGTLAVILLLEGTVRDVAVGRLDRKHQAEAVQRGRAGSSRGAAFDNS